MSEPNWRVMVTRRASPKEASQAPKVKRIINIWVLLLALSGRLSIIIKVRTRIIHSKHKRAINICFRWEINVRTIINIDKGEIV